MNKRVLIIAAVVGAVVFLQRRQAGAALGGFFDRFKGLIIPGEAAVDVVSVTETTNPDDPWNWFTTGE